MVHRWDIITIGNLSRNRYWGESEDRPLRPALCTCTLIQAGGSRLLIDPSCEDADRMAAELDRRAGLKPSDITTVFITHHHADHHTIGQVTDARLIVDDLAHFRFYILRHHEIDGRFQRGGSWYTTTVRNVLRNGAYAGLRQWDGIETEADALPQIVTPAQYEQAHAKLLNVRTGPPKRAQ